MAWEGEALVSSEQLLETMAEGVIVLDNDGVIRLWNQAMTEITGYDREEALGRPHLWLRAPGCTSSQRIGAWLEGPGANGLECLHGCECRILHRSGEGIPVLVNARALHNEQGTRVGALQTFVDFRPVVRLREQVDSLRHAVSEHDGFEGLIDVTVLISGESGTGKELAATAIHRRSPRADQPMVRVNCGALSETLLESELFGHAKGAFTGAHKDRIGRFEAADGGSLFLDEIGEISPAMQVKLLRLLQEGEFERVGETTTRSADVRVIAATNRDLQEEMQEGRFREDLFYRLRVFPLKMPALRERVEDLPILVEHFREWFVGKTGKPIHGVAPSAMQAIREYSWPGNIRELENAIEYAFVVCGGSTIELQDLPFEVRDGASGGAARSVPYQTPARDWRSNAVARRTVESPEMLRALLEECDWNKSEAGRRLGLSHTAIWKWMKRHGIPLRPDDA
jgi:PAS domain S-box-containing protein